MWQPGTPNQGPTLPRTRVSTYQHLGQVRAYPCIGEITCYKFVAMYFIPCHYSLWVHNIWYRVSGRTRIFPWWTFQLAESLEKDTYQDTIMREYLNWQSFLDFAFSLGDQWPSLWSYMRFPVMTCPAGKLSSDYYKLFCHCQGHAVINHQNRILHTISKFIKEFPCCSEQVWEWRAAISVADVAGCF